MLIVVLTARGRVRRVTDCTVRGLEFKPPGSILTSRTETSSLSRVVRDGWDPCSIPLSGGGGNVSCGGVFDLAVEQPQLLRKLPKNKNKKQTQTGYFHLFFAFLDLYEKPVNKVMGIRILITN